MNLVNSSSFPPGIIKTSTRSLASFWVIKVFCAIGFPVGPLASVSQVTVLDAVGNHTGNGEHHRKQAKYEDVDEIAIPGIAPVPKKAHQLFPSN